MSEGPNSELDDLPAAVPARTLWGRLPLVWILPAVVVLVGGFVVVREKLAQGTAIQIRFQNAEGLEANKTNFAAYIPGEFPDNLKSYKIVNAKTIVLTLNGSYNPTWFTYDQLSQITPLPAQAWDKTSASGKVGNYDETTSGAKAVFNFLTAQLDRDVTLEAMRITRRIMTAPPMRDIATDEIAPA